MTLRVHAGRPSGLPLAPRPPLHAGEKQPVVVSIVKCRFITLNLVQNHSMRTSYETDVVAWANEQAALIRAGRFDQLDLEHLAEEIEDVGKSEQRELANRMAVLLMHLLKWEFQPTHRGASWERTIKDQRSRLNARIKNTPSLKPSLVNEDWIADAWADAVRDAAKETGIDADKFPENSPWSMTDVLTEGWLPE